MEKVKTFFKDVVAMYRMESLKEKIKTILLVAGVVLFLAFVILVLLEDGDFGSPR